MHKDNVTEPTPCIQPTGFHRRRMGDLDYFSWYK